LASQKIENGLRRNANSGRVAAGHAPQDDKQRQVSRRQSIRQSHHDVRGIKTRKSGCRANIFNGQCNASGLHCKRIGLRQSEISREQNYSRVMIRAEVVVIENAKRSAHEGDRIKLLTLFPSAKLRFAPTSSSHQLLALSR
jgi:hypothetical protein